MILAVAIVIAAASAYSNAGASSRPMCQYPSLRIWLTGGSMNVQGGRYASYPCPAGRHPAHKLIVVRHRGGGLSITMAPSARR